MNNNMNAMYPSPAAARQVPRPPNMNPNLPYNPAPAPAYQQNRNMNKPSLPLPQSRGQKPLSGVGRNVSVSGQQRPTRYMAPMKTKSRLGELQTGEAGSDATKQWSDPFSILIRGGVLISCLFSTFLVPRDLRFIWLLVLALLVIGGLGLDLYHAWIGSSDSEESETIAKYILWFTTGLFSAVLSALLIFLALKLVAVAQKNSAFSKDKKEKKKKDLKSRGFGNDMNQPEPNLYETEQS